METKLIYRHGSYLGHVYVYIPLYIPTLYIHLLDQRDKKSYL